MAFDDIAGYSLRRSLGAGSAGTVWLVRHLGSGRNAVLKRIRSAAYPAIDRLRADLAMLQRLDHPHIARVHEVRRSGEDWLVFSQHLVAGSLAALLARRGPLTPGELVTLLNPLAEALRVLHHHGLIHGRVDAANIMFDADGRPVLTDTALHRYAPAWQATEPRTPPTPATDLAALSAIARQAGGDPTVFTPDYFTATTHLPDKLLTFAPPTPIDLNHSTPTPKRPTHPPPPQRPFPRPATTTRTSPGKGPIASSATRRVRRMASDLRDRRFANGRFSPLTLLALAGCALTIVLGAVAVVLSLLNPSTPTSAAANQPTAHPPPTVESTRPETTREPPPTAATQDPTRPATTGKPRTPAAPRQPTEPATSHQPVILERRYWIGVLRSLDAMRARVLSTLDPGGLDRVYLPGSAPWRADRDLLTTYRRQNVKVEGLRISIDRLTVVGATRTTITLRTTDHLAAGHLITPVGHRTRIPPGRPTARLIVLTRSSTTWRISSVTGAQHPTR